MLVDNATCFNYSSVLRSIENYLYTVGFIHLLTELETVLLTTESFVLSNQRHVGTQIHAN